MNTTPEFHPPEYDMEEEHIPLFRNEVSDEDEKQFRTSWGLKEIGWKVTGGIAGAALTLIVMKAGKRYFAEHHETEE